MLHPSSPNTKHPGLRWIENGHILLWLMKDICWVSEFKLGGMIMILPTLSVAIYILAKSWKNRAAAFHNGAVCLWIAGNSVWMTGEFYNRKWEPFTVALFAAGLLVLLYYYLFIFHADRMRDRDAALPPQ